MNYLYINTTPYNPFRLFNKDTCGVYYTLSTYVTKLMLTKSDTKNSSLYDILKRHKSELLGVISDPDKLANDLSSVDLISHQVKDDVLRTQGLSRYQKCSILLYEIQGSLRVYKILDRLILFCDVLKQ